VTRISLGTTVPHGATLRSPLSIMTQRHAYRAHLLDYTDSPLAGSQHVRYVDDGLLVVEGGSIVAAGEHAELSRAYPDAVVRDYRGKLILPGFIDAHVHYAQTQMIASYGRQLLEWLESYVFPEEARFGDPLHATRIAAFFLRELLRNGTTSALVLGTVHPVSVDCLAQEALKLDLRLILGKVLMDRHAPEGLRDTAQSGYDESKALIGRWHQQRRLLYAITPRFAPTSSPRQLELAGALKAEFPTTYVHSHLSENKHEVAWVRELFPEQASYTEVYDRYGLLTSRSLFAHGLQLSAAELELLGARQASIAFCPTSNLFLGSGLFGLQRAREAGVKVAIGTDVGAGTSLSVLRTLSEAYKVLQLQDQSLSAHEALYLATLGGARALSLADRVGNFAPGKEADFVVHELDATPLQAMRAESARTLEERLFAFVMLGDDRNVHATYVNGKLAYQRQGFL
jgi:guanine deaminase